MSLTRTQRIGWGLADMGVVVFVVVKQLLVFAFLTSALGVPVQLAGAITTGILIFDMVTDPLMGLLSDRTRSRWGRRLPWMALGAPVMVAAMAALFSVSPGPAAPLWVAFWFAVSSLGFTMIAIPYGAMAGEITQDGAERSRLTAWRMAFASLGLLIGGAVIPGLAAQGSEARAVLQVSPLILGAVWGSVWLTRNAPRIDRPVQIGWGAQLGLVLRNRPFVVLAGLYGLMTLAIAIMTAGLAFVALYLVADPGTTPLSGVAKALGMLSLLFACFTLGALCSQPLWVWLSARLGKRSALCLGLTAYAALLLGLRAAFPDVGIMEIAGIFVAAGICNGAYQQIPWALYPDLMDETRSSSGEAIEGAFSALWLFGQKLGNALGPLILGLMLARGGWQETTDGKIAQSREALTALINSVTYLPAALLAASVLGLILLFRPRAHS